MTALTSSEFDYFVTCDKNLSVAAKKILDKNSVLLKSKGVVVPEIIWVKSEPNKVAKAILKL